MTIWDFEFGSNGDTIKTSDGFASVNKTPKISTAWKAGGTRSADCSTTSNDSPNLGVSEGGRTTGWETVAFQLDGRPSANQIVMQGMDSSFATTLWQVRVLTDGTVQFRDAFSAKYTSTATISTSKADYRFALLIDGTTVRLKVYDGANSSSTLLDSGNLSSAYSKGSWDGVRYGQVAAATWGILLDNINRVTGTTEPGAAVSPPTIDLGGNRTIQDYASAAFTPTVTGNTGTTTYAWTVQSGPSTSSGQFSAPSSKNTTFTPAGGPGTYTLRLSVTDDSGVTTKDATVTVTALQAGDTIAAVTVSSGWTASAGTVLDCLSDGDSGTYVTSSNNPSSLDLKVTLRGIIPPTGNLDVWLRDLGRSGGTGTVDVSLYKPDGTTLVKKVSGTTAPTSAADTKVTFLAADISGVSAAQWRAGCVLLVEATAS